MAIAPLWLYIAHFSALFISQSISQQIVLANIKMCQKWTEKLVKFATHDFNCKLRSNLLTSKSTFFWMAAKYVSSFGFISVFAHSISLKRQELLNFCSVQNIFKIHFNKD